MKKWLTIFTEFKNHTNKYLIFGVPRNELPEEEPQPEKPAPNTDNIGQNIYNVYSTIGEGA